MNSYLLLTRRKGWLDLALGLSRRHWNARWRLQALSVPTF